MDVSTRVSQRNRPRRLARRQHEGLLHPRLRLRYETGEPLAVEKRGTEGVGKERGFIFH